MAIQTLKAKKVSNHEKMTNLVKSLAKQLGPKKSSANTRIQGALTKESSAFFADSNAVKQVESSLKVRIHLAGTELTVSSRN